MSKVVGLGACVYDTLITCAEYPVEDTKQRANNVFVSGGGPVGNALVVMSKLGIDTKVIGAFADDDAGKYLRGDFVKYGVGVENAAVVSDAVSFTSYIILSQKEKSRTCVFDRGTVLDDPASVCVSAIDGADVLHLDGNYLESAIFAANYARAHGVKVSLDAGGLYAGIERLLPLVDILIPSAEFATGFTQTKSVPEAMQELYRRFAPEVLVVTNGSDGGYYRNERGETVKYGSVKVHAVDTNGAGDTFHGAFVAGYCNGKRLADCCAFASRVAAYKCSKKGLRMLSFSQEEIAALQ